MHRTNSLATNVSLNLVNQVSSVLFPLITFPYVSRVLEPDGLGRVAFTQAVLGYFAMAASLGIPLYGLRESAKRRDDGQALSQLAAEIFLLNLFTTILALAGFGLFMLLSRKASEDPSLFCICALPMLVAPFGFGWLFGGLEQYVYITVRTLVFRVLVLGATFLFIRAQTDFRVYALIFSLNAVAGDALNLFFVRKYFSWNAVALTSRRVLQHLKPALLLFSLFAITSVYTSLDQVMLGYLTDDAQVGLYSAANRLVKVVLMLVTGLGVVLVPRLSYYLGQQRSAEYRSLCTKSLRVIAFVSFPAAAGLIVLSRPAMLLLAGDRFDASAPLVQIMAFDVVLIALSNFIGFQVLFPQGKEKLLVYSVFLGAVGNCVLNWFLIPHWQAAGAAVATLITEALVTVVLVIVSRPYASFAWPMAAITRYSLVAAAMAVVSVLLATYLSSPLPEVVVVSFAGAAFYAVATWGLGDDTLHQIAKRLGLSARS